ncbi:oxidoreductase [Flavobacterium noncentrifugens]|uniref:Predicted oxidoreductase n=1 Tax=Flavobacterium noncentrifugens TaxID=1128970 RepID=A0A1G8ZGQ1_9FLAO|nr:aldo/keto reductase [Flavobacterium noncentrifugens]GEP51967.1 oxidoreductase [Flavobacterium noncentrifugens]SDK13575.1 Predicted oxidoreductase [Flavobacterium noncentrifugens]
MKYKLFGSKTGLYSSEVILGAANFGTRKGYGASPEESKQILAAYKEAGGNFIDVSDTYQLGEAEEIVGEFLKGQRNNFIVCSKYTRSSEVNPAISNFGNHRKSMKQAVEASLKRLKTDYIDIYMPHFDDGVTPLDEIIRGLEDLVKEGKILYTGLTNFPAWKASSIASAIKLTALQIEYNLLQRTADRELLPMAQEFGLGIMMYSPMAGGLLTGKYRDGASGRMTAGANSEYKEDEKTKAIIDALVLISKEVDATPGQVAFAWVLSKDTFPLIGARKLSHLEDSLRAITIPLTREHLATLDRLSAISLGYPHDLLATVKRSM